MLSSMTGFGRAVVEASLGRLIIEIQSVNRKYLEVFVSLPKEMGRFEVAVRKWVGEAVSRGQVSARVFLIPNEKGLIPDIKLLKTLKKKWDQIAKALGTEKVDLPFLMQYLPALQEEAVRDDALEQGVRKALQELVKMKKAEGKALAKDLDGRLKELERLIRAVEKEAPTATKKMREKLLEKIEEVYKGGEERLLREVALFAEKVDISEEIVRFQSHLDQFHTLLRADSVGRKMDFLIQEMGREVNTIGSKSMEAKISHLVVALKSELEKMREQVQNIE